MLVCTGGWPNTVAGLLLDRLRECGCALRFQGDFDRDGRRIAEHVARRHGARGWRTDAASYVGAARRREGRAPDCGAPAGEGALAVAMRRERVAVYEEDVLEELLEELEVSRVTPEQALAVAPVRPHPRGTR